MLVLLVLLLTAVLVAGGYLWSLAHSFDSGTTTIENALPADSPAKDPAAGNSQNILLIGTDSRDPGSEASRSDTMMLLHVPGDRSTAYVMSIMRDTWTEIPGYGEGKINSAMAQGEYRWPWAPSRPCLTPRSTMWRLWTLKDSAD